MKITAELSFYPMGVEDYKETVLKFIKDLKTQGSDLTIEVGTLNTQIVGEYGLVMDTIYTLMEKYFTDYDAVYTLKIANACPDEYEDSEGGGPE